MPPAFHITCLFPSYLASFALTYLASILIHHATVLFGEVLHPLLTFHVLLSVVAGTVDCMEFFFRNELLSGQRTIGIVVDRFPDRYSSLPIWLRETMQPRHAPARMKNSIRSVLLPMIPLPR